MQEFAAVVNRKLRRKAMRVVKTGNWTRERHAYRLRATKRLKQVSTGDIPVVSGIANDRNKAIMNIANIWMQSDPTSAKAWLDKTSLPGNLKQLAMKTGKFLKPVPKLRFSPHGGPRYLAAHFSTVA
jgi:hypothetical protein